MDNLDNILPNKVMIHKDIPDHYKPTAKRIEYYINLWEPLLDLPGITVEHKLLPTTDEDQPDKVADTSCLWEYRVATIRWYLGRCATLSDADIENSVVHEYVHVLIHVMEKHLPEKFKNSDHAEHAVENITRALLGVYHRKSISGSKLTISPESFQAEIKA